MLFIALGYHFWGTWQSPSQSRLNPNSIYFLIEDNSSCLFFGIAPIPFIWLLFLALLSSSIQSILIFGINCCEELFSTAVTLVVITVQGVPIHPFVNQPPLSLRCRPAHSNSILTFSNNIYRHICYCLSSV